MSMNELLELCLESGESSYRCKQIADWLYRKGSKDIASMTNLSKDFRSRLSDKADLYLPEIVSEAISVTDGSRKLLLRLRDGNRIETVILPEAGRMTVCLSTQVGCSLDCVFCRTGTMGFTRNLDAGEIVGQLILAENSQTKKITNVVLMGMGEPLLNLDNVLKAIEIFRSDLAFAIGSRKITLSTSGLLEGLRRIENLRPSLLFGIAVSLNAVNQEMREKMMPAAARQPLDKLLDATGKLARRGRRGLTFEYVIIGGVNDSLADAKELARLVGQISCKVNLIPFNSYPGAKYEPPSGSNVKAFHLSLLKQGIAVTLRESRGNDIQGACGQLAAELRGKSEAEQKLSRNS